MSSPLSELETPALVVDLDRLSKNLERTAAYATSKGLALRPHVKTHKSAWIGAEQRRLGAIGLTCATPREIEVMAALVDDLLLAYPPVGGWRARRLASLADKTTVTVALDSSAAVGYIGEAATGAGRTVRVLVELDVGMKRVGVADVDGAITLAHLVQRTPGLEYGGIMFYPGHVRVRPDDQDESIAALNKTLERIIDGLDRVGMRPPVVSGGSTPMLSRSHEVYGVTEIRPGTYVYNDRATVALDVCTWEDCALTILATVVSTSISGQVVIDAGTKALGREPMRESDPPGFGALLDHPEVVVKQMSEEHGILDTSRTDWMPRVGSLVRIVPNHVCVAVHLADTVHGVRGGHVERSWPVDARGRERVEGPR